MLRVVKQDDVLGEMDSYSVDFCRAFVDPAGPRVQLPDSGPMWGPGVKLQDNPSVIMTQQLSIWRTNNAQLPAEKAAEELEKLYATLPEEAFDLTFKDLIDRKGSLKRRPSGNEGDGVKSSDETVAGQNGDLTGGEKKNSLSISIPTKIATLFSPRRSVSSPTKAKLSPEELDILLRKRGKQSSKREGLYSASVTPTGSFRQVSPLMSPRTSFSDQALQSGRVSFEAEIAKSGELNGKATTLMKPPSIEQTPHLLSAVPSLPPIVPSSTGCSGCSTTKQNLKTRCMVCGKAYCGRCAKDSLERKADGRRCKSTCVGKPINDEFAHKAVKKGGCLPFFRCGEPEDSKKTTSKVRRQVRRTEEYGVELTHGASLF